MTIRVHAWMADTGGCGYYRGLLPHTVLGGLDGFATTSHPHLGDGADDVLDVLWVQRVTRPEPTARLDALLARGDRRPRLVMDADDALDLVPESSLTAHAYYLGPTSERTLDRWVENLRKVDIVTASTLHLATHLVDELGVADAVVIPNTIDANAAKEPLHPILGHPFPLTIGYQGSDTHYGDVGVLEYALRQFTKRHPDAGVHMIGHDWTTELDRWAPKEWGRGRFHLGRLPPSWTIPAGQTRHTPWLDNIAELYQVVRGFDIGLAPLAEHPFNLCKSPIKLLEYGHLGVPWIASDVGPYRQWAADAGGPELAGGILVGNKAHDWLEALEALAGDADLRAELVANGAAWAAQNTTQRHADALASLYRHLTGGHQ